MFVVLNYSSKRVPEIPCAGDSLAGLAAGGNKQTEAGLETIWGFATGFMGYAGAGLDLVKGAVDAGMTPHTDCTAEFVEYLNEFYPTHEQVDELLDAEEEKMFDRSQTYQANEYQNLLEKLKIHRHYLDNQKEVELPLVKPYANELFEFIGKIQLLVDNIFADIEVLKNMKQQFQSLTLAVSYILKGTWAIANLVGIAGGGVKCSPHDPEYHKHRNEALFTTEYCLMPANIRDYMGAVELWKVSMRDWEMKWKVAAKDMIADRVDWKHLISTQENIGNGQYYTKCEKIIKPKMEENSVKCFWDGSGEIRPKIIQSAYFVNPECTYTDTWQDLNWTPRSYVEKSFKYTEDEKTVEFHSTHNCLWDNYLWCSQVTDWELQNTAKAPTVATRQKFCNFQDKGTPREVLRRKLGEDFMYSMWRQYVAVFMKEHKDNPDVPRAGEKCFVKDDKRDNGCQDQNGEDACLKYKKGFMPGPCRWKGGKCEDKDEECTEKTDESDCQKFGKVFVEAGSCEWKSARGQDAGHKVTHIENQLEVWICALCDQLRRGGYDCTTCAPMDYNKVRDTQYVTIPHLEENSWTSENLSPFESFDRRRRTQMDEIHNKFKESQEGEWYMNVRELLFVEEGDVVRKV